MLVPLKERARLPTIPVTRAGLLTSVPLFPRPEASAATVPDASSKGRRRLRAGAAALAGFLREAYGRPLPLVLGVLRDKDVASIVAPLTAVASRIVCTAAPSPRALQPSELAAIVAAQASRLEVSAEDTPRWAIALAAAAGSPVVVAGSLYLAGAVRRYVS